MAFGCAAWEFRQDNELFPFFDGDYPDYLEPALGFYQNGEISVHGNRSFVYPLFCGLVWKLDEPTLEDVTHFQQIFSFAAVLALCGAAVFAALRLFSAPLWLACGSGLAIYAAYLFAPGLIMAEWCLRPEIVSMTGQCFLLLTAVLAVAAWRKKSGRAAMLWTAVFAILGGSLFFAKKSWGLAVLSPVWFALLVPPSVLAKFRALLVAAIGLVAAFVPLYLFQSHLQRRYDAEASLLFTPRYLLLWQADLIRPVLQKRVDSGETDPFVLGLNRAFEAEFSREKAPDEFRLYYGKFGYKPELLALDLNQYLHLKPPEQRAEIYTGLFLEALRTRPHLYAWKVLRQLGWYYGFQRGVYNTDFVDASMRFQHTWASLRKRVGEVENVLHDHGELARLQRSRDLIQKRPPRLAVRLLAALGTAFPFMLIATGIGIAADFRLQRPEARIQAKLVLLVLGIAFAVILTFALLSSLSIHRFISMVLPLTLFSQWLMFFYLGGWVRWIAGRRQSPSTP